MGIRKELGEKQNWEYFEDKLERDSQEPRRVTLAKTTSYYQARLPVEGLGSFPSHKTLDLQFFFSCQQDLLGVKMVRKLSK